MDGEERTGRDEELSPGTTTPELARLEADRTRLEEEAIGEYGLIGCGLPMAVVGGLLLSAVICIMVGWEYSTMFAGLWRFVVYLLITGVGVGLLLKFFSKAEKKKRIERRRALEQCKRLLEEELQRQPVGSAKADAASLKKSGGVLETATGCGCLFCVCCYVLAVIYGMVMAPPPSPKQPNVVSTKSEHEQESAKARKPESRPSTGSGNFTLSEQVRFIAANGFGLTLEEAEAILHAGQNIKGLVYQESEAKDRWFDPWNGTLVRDGEAIKRVVMSATESSSPSPRRKVQLIEVVHPKFKKHIKWRLPRLKLSDRRTPGLTVRHE